MIWTSSPCLSSADVGVETHHSTSSQVPEYFRQLQLLGTTWFTRLHGIPEMACVGIYFQDKL